MNIILTASEFVLGYALATSLHLYALFKGLREGKVELDFDKQN